jgi:hypothetical protein
MPGGGARRPAGLWAAAGRFFPVWRAAPRPRAGALEEPVTGSVAAMSRRGPR